MHSRRPLPALALVLPHPPLPNRPSFSNLSDALPPRTPRSSSPSTPVLFPRQIAASPRTSTDSWGSSSGNKEDEVHWDWKPEQMSFLVRTLDVLPGHLLTPFNGPVPPSNLLDKLARSVIQAQGPLEWPHSVRATRAKLAEIARGRDKGRSKENMTIDEQEEDKLLDSAGRRKRPLYRQSSMDFLPSKDKSSGSLSRLSSRLQRADRMITSYHPYPRPSSRSPSPPMVTPRSDSPRLDYFPPATPSRPNPIRTRTPTKSLASRPPQPLRRSASITSTYSNPVPTSGPTTPGVLSPIKPSGLIRRSDSFTYAAPTGPTLKRAPSFGAISIASGVSKIVTAEKQVQDPESDDEEKAREKQAKRPRTRSSPEKKNREKKAQAQKDLGVAKSGATPKSATSSPVKSKSRQKATRSGSMFGEELPQPQLQCALPADATLLPPKTLRRVKTTNFSLGTRLPARKISFGSVPEEQEREDAATPALGSAFQLS